MLYSHTLPAHVIGCYDCTQPGFEDWGSTQAQSLILALFPVMIEDNSDQTSNLVSYRLIFKFYMRIYYSVHFCCEASVFQEHSNTKIICIPDTSVCNMFPSIYLSIHPSVGPSVCPSSHPYVYLSVYLLVRPSVRPSVRLSECTYFNRRSECGQYDAFGSDAGNVVWRPFSARKY